MDNLLKIIDNRTQKQIDKNKLCKIVPARVLNIVDNLATVTLMDRDITLTLPNYSGSFINVGDEVKVVYNGTLTDSSYIISSKNGMVVCPLTEYNAETAIDNLLYFCYRE